MRNFPVIGHGRYLLETIRARAAPVHRHEQRRGAAVQPRPAALGLRQRPSWRTTTSASAPTTTSSTARATRSSSTAPSPPGRRDDAARAGGDRACPCAKVMGAARGRAHAFRPDSVVNISGMSFGSLSGKAIEALNKGAALAGCLQNTGEGGALAAPPPRRRPRLPDRHLLLRLPRRARPLRPRPARRPRAVGPGPGDRGQAAARAPSRASAACCPAAKVTQEIAEIRGIPMGVDCASARAGTTVFNDVDSMLDFVEMRRGRHRPAGRHQVRRRQPALSGTS